MNLTGLSAARLAGQIRAGQASPAEAAGAARVRIAEREPITVLNTSLDQEAVMGTPAIGRLSRVPPDRAAFIPKANQAGCPAISIPFSTTTRGLLLGLQVMAAKGRDASLLATSRTISAMLARQDQERAH